MLLVLLGEYIYKSKFILTTFLFRQSYFFIFGKSFSYRIKYIVKAQASIKALIFNIYLVYKFSTLLFIRIVLFFADFSCVLFQINKKKCACNTEQNLIKYHHFSLHALLHFLYYTFMLCCCC